MALPIRAQSCTNACLQLTEATIVACEEQQEAAGAIIMASEERMQCATSTSRLQHTAKLGVCGEMLQLTEATIGGMRRAARGCW